MPRRAVSCATLALMLAIPATHARAQWIPQGRAVSSSVGSHSDPVLVPDGAGGAYVAWQYFGPSPQNVYVSHVLADGSAGVGFGALGSPVAATAGPRLLLGAGIDGSGGLLVGWRVASDTWAQRFQFDGSPATGWGANGNMIALWDDPREMTVDGQGGGWFRLQADSRICPDICYESSSTSARYFNGAGVLDAGTFPVAFSGVYSGAGGVVFPSVPGTAVTYGYNGPALTGSVQGLNAAVAQAWSYPLDMSHIIVHAAMSDGSGGALLVTEGALGSLAPRLLRIDPNGALHAGFPSDGAPIRSPDAPMDAPVAAPGEAASVLVAWAEPNGGLAEIRLQKLAGSGAVAPGWPADGRVVCAASGGRSGVVIAPDGAGGAFLAWVDRRDEQAGDVYAHHVLADGTLDPAFATHGTGIATVTGGVDRLTIAPVASGSAILAWTDFRTFSEIRAQKLPLPGSAGVDPRGSARLALRGFAPNPAGASPRVAFTLASAGDASLELFDLHGRRVHEEVWRGLASGAHTFALTPSRPLAPGVYLLRLRSRGDEVVRRGMVSR